jgi:hypothetical protein
MYQVFKENPFLFKKNSIISNMAAYSIFQGKIVSLIPLAKIPENPPLALKILSVIQLTPAYEHYFLPIYFTL